VSEVWGGACDPPGIHLFTGSLDRTGPLAGNLEANPWPARIIAQATYRPGLGIYGWAMLCHEEPQADGDEATNGGIKRIFDREL
jgi:hypothetical protein